MSPAVLLNGVSKRYRYYGSGRDRLVEAFSFGASTLGRDFWALRDVDLAVEPGTTLGVLGRNGAGKSTLLSIIAGVLKPTRGSVRVAGRLVALLQLGAGFKPEYTGRENAMLNGLILGMSRKEALGKLDEIEAFADLGPFMDRPVKTYSSGMRARLGFAVAVSVEPDVLLVDETLSVGDAVFRQQGMQRMRELKEGGATILFVSHGLEMVRNFCTEAALLHEGRLLAHGDTGETIDRYEALISEIEARKKAAGGPDASEEGEPVEDDLPLETSGPLRYGTGEAQVEGVEVLDERGGVVELAAPEAPLTLRVHLRYAQDVPASSVRVILRNKAGLDIFSTSTDQEGRPIGPRKRGERVTVDFALKNIPLRHGAYGVTAAVSRRGAAENTHLDWVGVAAVFEVARPAGRRSYRGLVNLPTAVEVSGPDQYGDSDR
jgi:ABC-type polysaccharide/polyol phosphate transport system ATPase subunit